MIATKNLLIRASAGTGKTFQLSNRFIRQLAGGVPVDEILATTFTRKAAGEILDRVMLRLAEACVDDKKLRQLNEHAGPLDRAAARRLLVGLTRQLHRLRIHTLDSFFGQIARTHALELGLSPAWTIIDELDDARLRARAIEAVLGGESKAEVHRLMQLINAGAADRSVSERISGQVAGLYNVFQETNEAAWRRIPRTASLSEADVLAAIERLQAAEMPNGRFGSARDDNCAAALAEDWDTFLSKGLAAKISGGETTYYRVEMPAHVLALYQPLLQHAKGWFVNQLAEQTEATWSLLANFDAEYRRLKAEQRALRFDDVTRTLAESARLEQTAAVSYRLDASLGHLLLDEFQDTSLAQWQVVRPFADCVATNEQGTFFCVGDTKQAIYGWRGGVAEIFDAVARELGGVETDHLEQSFRSSPAVIQAVNETFVPDLADRHGRLGAAAEPCAEWVAAFPQHSTARKELNGYVVLETSPEAGPDEGQLNATLDYAAARVQQLREQAPQFNVGVLVRRNEAVRRLIYQLQRLGVDASEEGGGTLTDSAAVQLVLSLMRLIDHPGDTVAGYHVAHSPLGGSIGLSPDDGPGRVHAVVNGWRRRLQQFGYGRVIGELVEPLLAHANRREQLRLRQLTDLAYEYAADATLRCDDFVAFVEQQRVAEATEAPVRVMTVHQAKGLQFDIVVLPELAVSLGGQNPACAVGRPSPTSAIDRVCLYPKQAVQPFLPAEIQSAIAETEARRIKEAMCLLYVQMTRAVHALHMIIPPTKKDQKTESMPCKFHGLLRAAYVGTERVAENTVLKEFGDPRWYEQPYLDGRVQPKRPEPEAIVAPEPITLAMKDHDASSHGGRQPFSPSQLEGGAKQRVADLLTADNRTAMNRGTLMHAWFEQITWLDDDAVLDESLLRKAAAQGADAGTDVDALLVEFRTMLAAAEVRSALSRAAYADLDRFRLTTAVRKKAESSLELVVEQETSIAAIDGETLLTGLIDRLVILQVEGRPIAAEVIDFKTDRIADAEHLESKAKHYQPQLDAYRRATAKMLRIAPRHVTGKLLFVDA